MNSSTSPQIDDNLEFGVHFLFGEVPDSQIIGSIRCHSPKHRFHFQTLIKLLTVDLKYGVTFGGIAECELFCTFSEHNTLRKVEFSLFNITFRLGEGCLNSQRKIHTIFDGNAHSLVHDVCGTPQELFHVLRLASGYDRSLEWPYFYCYGNFTAFVYSADIWYECASSTVLNLVVCLCIALVLEHDGLTHGHGEVIVCKLHLDVGLTREEVHLLDLRIHQQLELVVFIEDVPYGQLQFTQVQCFQDNVELAPFARSDYLSSTVDQLQ